VPKQKITAAEKQQEIEALAANLKEQASQIRKVNDKVEVCAANGRERSVNSYSRRR